MPKDFGTPSAQLMERDSLQVGGSGRGLKLGQQLLGKHLGVNFNKAYETNSDHATVLPATILN
jgi:hypothetical protein